MKLADVSIRRPVLATVMVAVLVVFGVSGYSKLGLDMMPDVEMPVVMITAVYPGADPETIESKVVEKLEEAVSTVNSIKLLRSTSMESVGFVTIQFELERSADQATQDVRDKIQTALVDLPKDLEPPQVVRFDFNAAPILILALRGKGIATGELTRIADKVVRQELQSINGVGGIEIVGGQQREFHVYLNPGKLEENGLTAADVVQALGSQNLEFPGGRVDVGDRELTVKTRGQVQSRAELEDMILTAASGVPVRVGAVARVEDGVEEMRSYSNLDGETAIALMVRKQSGANTVAVADAVRAAAARLEARLPAGVSIAVPIDNSTFIRNMIHDVKFELALGAILAVVIILLFLHDWRATFISALALPISVIATFAFIQAMGFTLNMMTMLALSLSIGILIDDAIVVIENIHRHMEMGKPAMKAAADATAEIGLAVMATTATILAVFVPVATTKGIIGRILMQFGLTVAFAVTVSLFVAFTLTPMLSARLLKQHGSKNPVARGIEAVLKSVERGYRATLSAALRHRIVTLAIGVVALVAAVFLARSIPMEFMPDEDRGQLMLKIEMPAGTAFERTREYVARIAEEARKVPGVTSVLYTAGGEGAQAEANRGEVQVNLVPKSKRSFSQSEAMAHFRRMYGGRKDAMIAVEKLSIVNSGSAMKQTPIQYNLQGSDYEQLNRAAQELVAALRRKGGFVDLDTSYRGGKPEYAINIDRDRAADQGVPVALLGTTVRSLLAGDKVGEVLADNERHDIRLRLDGDFRNSREDLLALKVRSTNGALVQLGSVVSIDEGSGPAKIERQSRMRQVTVFASLENKPMSVAMAEVDAATAGKLQKGVRAVWGGMAQIMEESFANLFSALVLAILIIYLVLAAQFESWVHPLTIMISLPLSVVGAIGGLLIARESLGIMAMIGIILLMGLVTKNAILLVDYANTLRERGEERIQALIQAGATRLRPILMTTAAMVFGMIPVAIGASEGGEIRSPMAVAVIGGLLTSTFLTLVVVPVVYSFLDAAWERIFGKRKIHRTIDEAIAAKGS
ncbi:MAG: efflux RND transporter permease subunit [Deltaproteobacteria bacterium]|nr:efflux RND transporter permease subunit [Deltaproteobacteria bacterium]